MPENINVELTEEEVKIIEKYKNLVTTDNKDVCFEDRRVGEPENDPVRSGALVAIIKTSIKPTYPIYSIIYIIIYVNFHCFHSDDESIIDKEEFRIIFAASEDQIVIIKLIMINSCLVLSQSLNNHYIIAHYQSNVINRLSLIFSFFTNNHCSF
ncbi:Hypothetical_protein [Hexamita inflata]|uniref:Hypothetical_protein n=1 Tax=Hexamita inflata TaxID=28002 RepID=A0AA86PEB8_9EUKA|nr:Hypothetical protein HINF_LOCUS21817 [Hexamita inflata]CAI9974274.1 Hypothetical protein HINF_LOCUS61919 [Hexamita inflata]